MPLLDEQNDSWFFDVVFLGPKFEFAKWTQPRWDLPHRYRTFRDFTLIGSTARYLHIRPISDCRNPQENIAHMVSPLSPSEYHPEPERKLPLVIRKPLRLNFLYFVYSHSGISKVKAIPISQVFSAVITNSFKMTEITPPYHHDSQMSQRTHSPPAIVSSVGHEEGQSRSEAQEENGSLSEVIPTEVYWASGPSSPNFGAFGSLIAESEIAQFLQASETGGSPGTSAFGPLGAFDALDLNQDFPEPKNSGLPSPHPSEPTENIFPEMGLDTTPSVGFSYHMTSAPSYPGIQSQPMEFGSSDQMWVKF
jgi:hypothetical protein